MENLMGIFEKQKYQPEILRSLDSLTNIRAYAAILALALEAYLDHTGTAAKSYIANELERVWRGLPSDCQDEVTEILSAYVDKRGLNWEFWNAVLYELD